MAPQRTNSACITAPNPTWPGRNCISEPPRSTCEGVTNGFSREVLQWCYTHYICVTHHSVASALQGVHPSQC